MIDLTSISNWLGLSGFNSRHPTIYLKPNHFRLGFFMPARPAMARFCALPLERHPATTLVFGAIFPAFFSLFSVFLLSGQEARFSNDAGFRASGCNCELVWRGRLRMKKPMSGVKSRLKQLPLHDQPN
jgi:hypothetical protein